MKKNNKKKGLLLGIISTLVVAIVGYGVYSYYWAEGAVTIEEETISLDGFNVTVYDDDNDVFIANGATMDHSNDCEVESGYISCRRLVQVTNSGSNPVELSYDNMNLYVENNDGPVNDYTTEIFWSHPSDSWIDNESSKILDVGELCNLNVVVMLPLGEREESSDSGTQLFSPLEVVNYTFSGSFTLKAEEVHD